MNDTTCWEERFSEEHQAAYYVHRQHGYMSWTKPKVISFVMNPSLRYIKPRLSAQASSFSELNPLHTDDATPAPITPPAQIAKLKKFEVKQCFETPRQVSEVLKTRWVCSMCKHENTQKNSACAMCDYTDAESGTCTPPKLLAYPLQNMQKSSIRMTDESLSTDLEVIRTRLHELESWVRKQQQQQQQQQDDEWSKRAQKSIKGGDKEECGCSPFNVPIDCFVEVRTRKLSTSKKLSPRVMFLNHSGVLTIQRCRDGSSMGVLLGPHIHVGVRLQKNDVICVRLGEKKIIFTQTPKAVLFAVIDQMMTFAKQPIPQQIKKLFSVQR